MIDFIVPYSYVFASRHLILLCFLLAATYVGSNGAIGQSVRSLSGRLLREVVGSNVRTELAAVATFTQHFIWYYVGLHFKTL